VSNPYQHLPSKAFWRPAIAERSPLQIDELWTPKFSLGKDAAVATLGSCFAQHISRALVDAGYRWLNSEPAPDKFPDDLKPKFHYDVFSARLGNVYTVALLKQWVSWAFGLRAPSAEIWGAGGRYFDPFRPSIEPDGFESAAELLELRSQTLRALRQMFETCSIFVFTLGLTEGWVNFRDDLVYPMCPGTLAGEFDPGRHRFRNYSYPEIQADLAEVLTILRRHNTSLRCILTVSPVPLTATASAEHVLVATTYSKSTLRAVAGDTAAARNDVDYFPAYEIVSAFPFRGMFYEPDMRSVSKQGVDFVMQAFLGRIGAGSIPPRREAPGAPVMPDQGDEVCEEMLLDAFGRRK
jgi:hypothetical protein